MNIQPDFEELLRLLEAEGVSYMIVGGYAVAFFGFPRFTKDLDIFYELTKSNTARLKATLIKFGFAESELGDALFERGNIIKIGIEPVRIDLLNDIDGLTYAQAAKGTVRGNYGEVEVTFIGKQALTTNKRESGRLQDLADLEKLSHEG